jgi:hypothetical protein
MGGFDSILSFDRGKIDDAGGIIVSFPAPVIRDVFHDTLDGVDGK